MASKVSKVVALVSSSIWMVCQGLGNICEGVGSFGGLGSSRRGWSVVLGGSGAPQSGLLETMITSGWGGVLHGSIAGESLTAEGPLVAWSGEAGGVAGLADPLTMTVLHRTVARMAGLTDVGLLAAP